MCYALFSDMSHFQFLAFQTMIAYLNSKFELCKLKLAEMNNWVGDPLIKYQISKFCYERMHDINSYIQEHVSLQEFIAMTI